MWAGSLEWVLVFVLILLLEDSVYYEQVPVTLPSNRTLVCYKTSYTFMRSLVLCELELPK